MKISPAQPADASCMLDSSTTSAMNVCFAAMGAEGRSGMLQDLQLYAARGCLRLLRTNY
jgi:hypothetical protein